PASTRNQFGVVAGVPRAGLATSVAQLQGASIDMCGVFAYAGSEPAVPHVLRGLYDLEYRGYDSAGIAALDPETGIAVFRREGKIVSVESAVPHPPPTTGLAMGHTRWATHGRPSDGNAHPHRSCDGSVAVVHNGIVEN